MNHLSLKYLFTDDISVEGVLERCKILIIVEISHILVDFNSLVLAEGRSSRPLIGIMPEKLLQES